MGTSQSSLLTAAAAGTVEQVEKIINEQKVDGTADADQQRKNLIDNEIVDEDGKNALLVAAAGGHSELCKFLVVKYGANVEARCTKYYQTPLAYAVDNNHFQTVVALLSPPCFAKVDPLDQYGKTPLHLASYRNFLDIVLLLLKCGADINARDLNGHSPLAAACLRGHFLTAHALVQKGADADNVDFDGFTPLMHAAAVGHLGIVNLLLHEAKIKTINVVTFTEKSSALMCAARKGSNDIVRVLLDNWADPDLEDSRGQTAARIAELNQHKTVAMMIHTFNRERAKRLASGHFQTVHQAEERDEARKKTSGGTEKLPRNEEADAEDEIERRDRILRAVRSELQVEKLNEPLLSYFQGSDESIARDRSREGVASRENEDDQCHVSVHVVPSPPKSSVGSSRKQSPVQDV